MKIAKISLAALVALGAFSTVASATPLEEAIKNVDLSGYARYRYNNITVKKNNGEKDNTTAHHQFKSEFSFKAALDDNFYGVLSLRYNAKDSSAHNADGNKDNTNTTSTFNVKEFYLGYKVGNTTITAGKQTVGSFFTDDVVGTGNAAFAENLYGVAAIGSYDPVSFQLWYASLVDIVNLIAADVNLSFNVSDDISLGAQIQYGHADLDNKVGPDFKDTDFYATELSAEVFGTDLAAGYIGYKVHDKAAGLITLEDQGSFIEVGEIKSALDYTALEGRGSFWFLKAGYTFAEKFKIDGDYSNGKVKDAKGDKEKYQEYVARLTYDYSAKLKFSSFYAYEINKHQDNSKDKTKQLRFQAKYTF